MEAGASGYSAIACGLAPPLDCAVLFDTDNASLKLLKFSSQALKTVKTDDEGSVSRLNLTAPPPPPAFLPMGAVVTIHPLLAPQTALRHCYHDLYATAPGLGDKEDYDFVVEAGLSGAANTVSFRSLQLPTLYIHVDDPNQGVESNRISVDVPTSKVSASWVPVPEDICADCASLAVARSRAMAAVSATVLRLLLLLALSQCTGPCGVTHCHTAGISHVVDGADQAVCR